MLTLCNVVQLRNFHARSRTGVAEVVFSALHVVGMVFGDVLLREQ